MKTAICTQDIFKVEEKQTFFNGMIYFEKMRLLWRFHSSFRVISDSIFLSDVLKLTCKPLATQKWQSASYPFGVDRGMRAFLNDFTPLSEKEMYDRHVTPYLYVDERDSNSVLHQVV